MSATTTCERCSTEITRDRWVLSDQYDNGSRYRRVYHSDAHCEMMQAMRRMWANLDRITEEGRQRQIVLGQEMRERKNSAVIIDDAALMDEYLQRFDAIELDMVKRREAQSFIDSAEVTCLTEAYKAEQAAYRASRKEASA